MIVKAIYAQAMQTTEVLVLDRTDIVFVFATTFALVGLVTTARFCFGVCFNFNRPKHSTLSTNRYKDLVVSTTTNNNTKPFDVSRIVLKSRSKAEPKPKAKDLTHERVRAAHRAASKAVPKATATILFTGPDGNRYQGSLGPQGSAPENLSLTQRINDYFDEELHREADC